MHIFKAMLSVFLLLGLVGCDLHRRDSAVQTPRIADPAHQFAVTPIAPSMRAYRGTENPYTGKQTPPALPPVGQAGYAAGPVQTAARAQAFGPDGMPVGPVAQGLAAYDPKDLMPVRQLIWGGEYGAHDGQQPYRLAVGDELALAVQDHDELSGTMTVMVDGTVELPLVKDRVPARGKTLKELERAILAKLRLYAKHPRIISLGLNHAAGSYYYVLGAVRNPGRYPMGMETVKVSDAVFRANTESAAAGLEESDLRQRLHAETAVPMRSGFNAPEAADLGNVYVITPHRTQPTRRELDVAAALFEGRTGEDAVVRAGQIVFVPESNADSDTAQFARNEIAPLGATPTKLPDTATGSPTTASDNLRQWRAMRPGGK